MSLSAGASPPPGRADRRLSARAVRVAIALTVTLLLAGGVLAVAAIGQPRPAHAVLDVRFSTRIVLPSGRVEHHTFELWTDPTLSGARLRIVRQKLAIYYARDAGAWYAVGRPGPTGPWRRARLRPDQQPSMLTEHGVRGRFAWLRARARRVTPVDLRHHLAYAFSAPGVAWPYPYVGPTTIWLDGLTGLPAQYRNVMMDGTNRVIAITTVDAIRTISSAALPADFFTPPDRQPAPWLRVAQRMVLWLRRRAS